MDIGLSEKTLYPWTPGIFKCRFLVFSIKTKTPFF